MISKSISYGKQFIDDDDIDAVVNVLKSDFLTQGSNVSDFESKLSDYVGSNYCVAISSGTTALHIAYTLLNLSKGDEVITSPLTFAATSNAILYTGAKPVFVDIDIETGLIDISKIESKITDKTKAISVIHYSGLPCNMQEVRKIADKYNLKVIEDACHALGAKIGDDFIGSCKYSDVTVFSFHPVKHITTGEGGAITLNNKELYERALALRSHGIIRDNFKTMPDSPLFHEMVELGFNYRLTDFQAALGVSQLQKLDKFVEKRHLISEKYRKEFKNIDIFNCIKEIDGYINSYHLFPIIFKNNEIRNKAYNLLKEKNIFCQIHYMPVNRHYYYKSIGYDYKETPKAYDFYQRELSIPVYPKMSGEEIDYVVEAVKNISEGLI